MLLSLVLETIQTAMFTQDVFRAFTRGFDDVVIAAEVDTVWFSVPFMTGLSTFKHVLANPTVHFTEIFVVALLTQVFYCYRIAKLTRSRYAVAAIAMVRYKSLSGAFCFPS